MSISNPYSRTLSFTAGVGTAVVKYQMRFALLACSLMFVAAPPTQGQEAAPATVTLDVIVTDHKGKRVDDVRIEDVEILERGKPQKILTITKTTTPVDYCVLVDSSKSFEKILPSALEFAKFIINANNPTDQTCVVSFVDSDSIETMQEFTTDKDAVIRSFSDIKTRGGQSAVIDALYVSAKHVGEHPDRSKGRRKALVVITDGEERLSYYGEKKLRALLRELDVQIFAIGVLHLLSDEGGPGRWSPKVKAEELLHNIVEEAGGRVFFTKTTDDILDAAGYIVHDLRNQYAIRYEPADQVKKGFREVKVRVANSADGNKRKAFTRRGYFFGENLSRSKN